MIRPSPLPPSPPPVCVRKMSGVIVAYILAYVVVGGGMCTPMGGSRGNHIILSHRVGYHESQRLQE